LIYSLTKSQVLKKRRESIKEFPLVEFLSGRTIHLSKSIDIPLVKLNQLTESLLKAGAVLHDDFESCDIIVLNSRSGADYLRAYDSNKIIGTSSWIKDMVSKQMYLDPYSKLLFYV
jgi:hypothetical protein